MIVPTHIIAGEYLGIALVISVLDSDRVAQNFAMPQLSGRYGDGLSFRSFFATRADGFSRQRAKEFFSGRVRNKKKP